MSEKLRTFLNIRNEIERIDVDIKKARDKVAFCRQNIGDEGLTLIREYLREYGYSYIEVSDGFEYWSDVARA